MQNRFGLLDTDVMPIFMIIALDIVITLRFSINCLAVICSPTVIFSILSEASSETMAPGSTFHHISFRSTILVSYLLPLQSFTFRSINQKYQKYYFIVYQSLSDLTFASDYEGIDKPFIALGASLFDCLSMYSVIYVLSPTGLIPWFSN